jgi:hypothetical protein
MASERRGEWGTSTGRDSYTEKFERERRGGGGYDAGPGREGLPDAKDLDRPSSPCGAYGRTGERRGGVDKGVRKIQD